MNLKSLFLFAGISALALTACNKNEVPNSVDSTPSIVSVTLDLGQGLRANALADLEKNNVAPSIGKVHIYVLEGNTVKASKEVSNPSADWTALTNLTDKAGGIKFAEMPASCRVVIEANPVRAAILTPGATLVAQTLPLSISNKPYMVGENADPETVGTEPYNPTPGSKATVKRAKVELKNTLSRFQIVGIKFYNRVWNPAKGTKPTDANDPKWKDNANFNYTQNNEWTIEGFLLNRFAGEATVAVDGKTITPATTPYYSTTHVGYYNPTAKTWSLRLGNVGTAALKDVTANAAYLGGTYPQYALTMAGTAEKAAAFNFYPQGVVNNVEAATMAANTVPKIHIILKKGTETRFVNLTAYRASAAGAAHAIANETGKLYNINLTNETIDGVTGTPIVVVDDDPNNPGGNTNPDISKDKINLIAMVSVQNWAVVNLYPVLD